MARPAFVSGWLSPDPSSDSECSDQDYESDPESQQSRAPDGIPLRDIDAVAALCSLSSVAEAPTPSAPAHTLHTIDTPRQLGSRASHFVPAHPPVSFASLHKLLHDLQEDTLAQPGSGRFAGWTARVVKQATPPGDLTVFHFERLVDALSDSAPAAVERSLRVSWQSSTTFATLQMFGACQLKAPLSLPLQFRLREALQKVPHLQQYADEVQLISAPHSLPYFLQVPFAVLLFVLRMLLHDIATCSSCSGVDPINAGQTQRQWLYCVHSFTSTCCHDKKRCAGTRVASAVQSS